MATCKFLIKSSKQNQYATVYLRLRSGNNIDLTVATELKMYPEVWNNKSQTFKKRISFTENFTPDDKSEFENNLREIKNYVLKELSIATSKSIILSQIWLKNTIYHFHHPSVNHLREVDLNGYIELFITQIKDGSRLTTMGLRYKTGTIKNFEGFKNQFLEFQNVNKIKLSFDDISLAFYDSFIGFFNSKEYSPNTIGRHIKNLKTIMRQAREEGLHANREIDRNKFKILKIPASNIYLNDNEIIAIASLDLTDKPKLDLIRDVFLVGCYTAQRFSDYSKIKKSNITERSDGRMILKLIQQKTGEEVIIPINSKLVEILKKYDYNLPKTYEQKVNAGIKEIAKMAEINSEVCYKEIRGGIIKNRIEPKYNLIKTHTARRSGATNMFKAGIATIKIMKITGHRTEKEFLNYIKITKEESAVSLLNDPYFL
ncbi:site-specific integrase [Marinifilum sp. D737]|uniref:site-specific integrase n=1 Tax=Marinifilum sp. D737 TaxID=2969628 RepID=UPI002274C736|nr:site-specific integrase [Marinifilum sp. D737]MCY1636598.1 site-specific integrase [Marinifilum sp. D737]